MKPFLLILFAFSAPALAMGQVLSPEDKKKILDNSEFFFVNEVPLGDYKFDNENLNLALRSALISKKKKNTNTILGGVFLGIGAAWIITGIVVKNEDKDPTGISQDLAKGTLIGMGVISMGASIPFFIGAAKRKKNMEKSLMVARGLINK